MNDDPEGLIKEYRPMEDEYKEKIQEPDNSLKTPVEEKRSRGNNYDEDVNLKNRVEKHGKSAPGLKNEDKDSDIKQPSFLEKNAVMLVKFIMLFMKWWAIGVMIILVLSSIKWEWLHILHISDNVMAALIQSVWCSSAFGLLGLVIERFLPKRGEKF
ncbi:MAG: hypothetical protein LBG98_00325 [Puniceicoccales bacterium]|jgi:hypothetical protein|nr:hypothetical protein [Puniceicoccales bacterium]